MRFTYLTCLAGVVMAVAISTAHAQSAWRGYVNREIGFSFIAPGEVKTEKTTYRSASAGQRDAAVFRSLYDNIEYKVTVVDFTGPGIEGPAVIKEVTTAFQDGKQVMVDVEAGVDRNAGRKMTVDLPNNGGRSMSAIYFKGGRLIQLQVTVLPANGDYGTPDTGRFVDSIAFLESRVLPDATELTLPK